MKRLAYLGAGLLTGVLFLLFEPRHRIDFVEALLAILNVVGVLFLAFFGLAIGVEAIKSLFRKEQ
ncbi:hypothetical protein BAG01nite_24670 [Brevibacillus agri]|uniref:Uncharacterized protein n=1 Tax=Brevibacillus agri TaxID=51101 RepID=A0A3M8AZQ0_9BACL|nr:MULTISPECIES: hypothetical protein [Brevibacillus]ELK39930.1 hypothetical protein D478_21658 [Brevibacillus agri BAB-2500]EJL44041.1 hypothetical protein PMI08_02159 [Brevibacillus sp. CF112]MBY0053051.1 hypothetical protein [Brevibacillus agri]MCG5254676.1 hypothetical protein [Brevibacillus agri]MDN4092202.1 hypothetical protein [Brevibacillus agri]